FVRNRIAMQEGYLRQIRDQFDGEVRGVLPLFDNEVRGVAMLRRAAEKLFA
ncbi:MAG: ArsA-related P-loop ATPase, partial [Actinomycetota bacterium]